MSSSACFLPLLVVLLLFLTVAVESRPSLPRDDKQVLHSLFGAHLSSLILAPPTSDDVTESSARPAAHGGAAARGPAGGREKLPRYLRDFLQRQTKMRRRGRKSMVGGRGCFGMKMDRIGSISGLGC